MLCRFPLPFFAWFIPFLPSLPCGRMMWDSADERNSMEGFLEGEVGRAGHYFSSCPDQFLWNINMFAYNTTADVMNSRREVVKTVICCRWGDFASILVCLYISGFELFLLVQLILLLWEKSSLKFCLRIVCLWLGCPVAMDVWSRERIPVQRNVNEGIKCFYLVLFFFLVTIQDI